jgi:hypothetical protein
LNAPLVPVKFSTQGCCEKSDHTVRSKSRKATDRRECFEGDTHRFPNWRKVLHHGVISRRILPNVVQPRVPFWWNLRSVIFMLCSRKKADALSKPCWGKNGLTNIPERSRPIGGDLHRIKAVIGNGTPNPQHTSSADLAPRPQDQGSQNTGYRT